MEGNLEYTLQNEKNIQHVIDARPELYGFYSFISDLSRTTAYNYLNKINGFLNYANKPPEELTIDDFSGFLLNKRMTENGTISTSSYRIQVYQALKKYGKYLVVKGVLPCNPMDSIDRPASKESQTTIEKREKGYLSKSEIKTYISCVKNGVGSSLSQTMQKRWRERDIAIIYIFLSTGIRCSALYKLDVDSIDFDNKVLKVTDKEDKVNIHHLSDEVLKIISDWLEKREELLGGKQEEALFISNRLNRMCDKAINNVVRKYAKEIKGKNISAHKLRATYGTQLYDETKDIYFVQKCMNHSSPQTTELYIRGQENCTLEASEIMNNLLK